MASSIDTSVINIEGNTTKLVSQINKANSAMQGFDNTLLLILDHLTQVEKGIGNTGNNIGKQINNKIKKQKNVYDMGDAAHVVSGPSGAISSATGRDKLFRDYEQAIIDLTNAERELTEETKKDVQRRKQLRKQRAAAETQRAANEAARVAKKEDQSTAAYQARMDKLADAKLLNAQNRVGAKDRSWKYQWARMLSSVGGALGGLGTGGKLIGDLLSNVGAIIKSPAAGLMTTFSNLSKAMIDLGKASVQAYSDIQAIKTQLGVVFSNQTQADAMFGEISQYAVKSPFGVQQTSELAVLLKQSGVYASDLMDTLKMLGDTAGGNMEKMKRIANNYAQIVSIGKASMLDMRQFAYAGIPIFEAVSKELGVSQQQLRKLISDGKVTSDIIEKVFKDLTGINGIFNEATSKGAKTLKARLQNLSDAKQLALSGIGDWIVNSGVKTGNDSYVVKMVSWAEDFYDYVKNNVNTKNIQRDVETIANRNDRIEVLRKLINETKNKELKTTYQRELEAELAKRNFDEERNKYTTSYDSKEGRYERALEALAGYAVDNPLARYSSINLLAGPSQGYQYAKQSQYYDTYKDFTQQELETLRPLYGELIEALRELGRITDEEVGANKESNLLAAQQLAFDQVNKGADRTDSLASSFQELTNIYKESDEYKEQQEKERMQKLEEALKVLKVIAENTDEAGMVDVTKFTVEELSNYFSKNAFTLGKKLDVVPKNGEYSSSDRNILEKQYGYITGELLRFVKSLGPEFSDYAAQLEKNSIETIQDLDNDKFYDQFKNIKTENDNIVKELKRGVNAEQLTKLNIITGLVDKLLSTVEADTEGKDANLDAVKKAANQEFIPLWKRIIAQATGLSAEGIKKSETALSDYRNDMAVRALTSNVMQAAMKAGSGTTSAMSLARAGNQVAVLKGTTSEVVQIDWKETREAVKEFALQLSASTEVITAYKNTLEEELNTYRSLLAAGYTTAETQEVKNQRYISGKKWERLMETADSQLVNAFGESLITKAGQEVWLKNVEGAPKYLDAEGNEIDVEELVLTESMFNIIKKTLPQIENELHEANAAQLKNTVIEDMLKDVKTLYLQRMADSNGIYANNKTTEYLWNNPEYLESFFDSALSVAKNRHKTSSGDYGPGYEWLEGMSDNDLLLEAMKGNASEHAEQVAEIIATALKMVGEDTSELIGRGIYKGLEEEQRRKGIDEAVQERKKQYRNFDSDKAYSTTAWADEGGVSMGGKFIKDFFDVEKGYTMKDLYKSYADEMHIMVEEMTDMDKFTVRWRESLQDVEDVMKGLTTSIVELSGQIGRKAFLTPFEKWGETLLNGKEWTEETADAMEDLAAETLKALGPIMAKAGFELVARGAINGSLGLVAGGLALAAAGGFATGIGNALAEGQEESKDSKEADKLQSLKDQLADLLDQARKDALYYESNLRHKTALGINKGFSMKSVNDAIITPQGDVVTTDPKDYLIATKTPNQLINGTGNVTVSPVINCNVVNNTSAKVTQQQQQNADGSIDIITIIEDVAGQYIASSKSDEAFNSREYRLRGHQSIMN